MSVLVLGATGLLGHAVFRRLSDGLAEAVFGTIRDRLATRFFASYNPDRLIVVDDIEDVGELTELLDRIKPHSVINCLAAPKQASDAFRLFTMYSLLPQRLAQLCKLRGCRLIHFSSDGVFSGTRGCYTEDDIADSDDTYGIAKFLGEIRDSHAITLRTSVIGHELRSKSGIVEWFLGQETECRGYVGAIFSGFPNVVMADILKNIVLPRHDLNGIYHLASYPISKFDLLQLIASRYGRTTRLIPDRSVAIDRSLNGERFTRATGYVAPSWPVLVDLMFGERPR